MRNNTLDIIVKQGRRQRMLKRAVALLSVIVILLTVNSTKFIADTLERIPSCGYDYDHQHGPECYDSLGNLVCALHVHTDACYQRRPEGDADIEPVVEPAEAVELDSEFVEDSALQQVEPAVEEVTLELGDEAEAAAGVESEAFDVADGIEPSEADMMPLYYVGEQYPFFLSDVLAACELDIPLSDVVEIGQVMDSDDTPQTLSFERIEDDYAIYPILDCEDQALAGDRYGM